MTKYLVPYITAGYPNKEWLGSLIRAADEGGADFIEVGIPFSDPIADGPVIQAASQQALSQGTHIHWVIDEVAKLKGQLSAKLILFSYYNPILALGDPSQMAAKLADAGFHGVLVPDMALEESTDFVAALNDRALHYIPLIAPTTTKERLERIAELTTSIAYGVSVTGVTGVRQGVSQGLNEYLARVRDVLDKEFVVGFGVSTPEDARNIAAIADGVVVGSAIVKKLGDFTQLDDATSWLRQFLKDLKAAISEH